MFKDLTTGIVGVAVETAHDILQLVAEAGGAAHLVEAGTGKETGGIDLVEIPAVEHVVERGVGRVDLDDTQFLVPEADHLVVLLLDVGQGDVAQRVVGFLLHRDNEGQFVAALWVEGELQSHPFAVGVLQVDSGERLGGGELHPHVAVDFVVDVAYRDAVGVGVPFGVEVASRLLLVQSQHQLVHHVELYRQRLVGFVLDFDLVIFLGTLCRDEETHHDRHVVVFGVEGREALSVACRGGDKLLTVDEQHFRCIVADDVVAPARQFELLGVEGEGEARHGGADHATKARIGDDVDPRHGGVGVGDHIVAALLVKASVLVVVLKRTPHAEFGTGF